MPGWETDKKLHSEYRSGKPDSPGCAEEQHAEAARLQAELLRLSIAVSTYPFWGDVDREDVVQARTALQHAHEQPAEA